MEAVKQHLDKQDLQKVLGEMLHRTRAYLDGPAPDLQILTQVILSRYPAERTANMCAQGVCKLSMLPVSCMHTHCTAALL